ncbi:TonB-dependent receptor [Halioxenophilus sp. WMMB6]|uniref:TonB-dependent receptor n=1 Tax=Halioxenophilus sp. WMMB6 TaxID=3073815 RepID=UPI00295F1AA1|nr:TonB-dependent receptor [Halioxenophilus sp. WMMB6]
MNQKPSSLFIRKNIMALAVVAVSSPAFAAEDSGKSLILEEIVVTAQRREASNQDVAVAVTAVNEQELELTRVDSAVSLQALSPSISYTQSNSVANTANIVIRGIGTVGNSRSFEGAVGVFIDGVYRTRAGQAVTNWLDIGSVQILRGPQGTLFGKNTSAGALLITSVAPDISESGGSVQVTMGDYDKTLVKARYNQVLSDSSALRVAGLWGEEDGFISDPNGGTYNDSAPRALKAQYLFEPSDTFSLHVIADWTEQKDVNCCYGQVDDEQGPSTAIVDAFTLAQGKKTPSNDFEDYEAVLSNKTDQDITDQGVSMHIKWGMEGGMELNSITAYRDWSSSQIGMDADFGAANILTINETFDTKVFSQEFTLSGEFEEGFGPIKRADYIVGAYFADEDIDATHQLLWGNQAQAFWDIVGAGFSLPPGTIHAAEGLWADHLLPADSRTTALFTHWNLDLTDDFSVGAGLRYSKDKKSGALQRVYFSPDPFEAFRLLGIQPAPTYDETFDDSAVTGSLAVQYHFADNVMGYLSYSRGYKSGGINFDNTAAGTVNDNPNEPTCGITTPVKPAGDCTPNDPSYESETINGYEMGLKSELWGGRARVNVTTFYNEIKNLQIATFDGLQFLILNGPLGESYGAELETLFNLNSVFTMNFDATWLGKYRYDESDDPALADYSDEDFARAAEWNANFGLTAHKDLGSSWSLVGKFSTQYLGEIITSPGTTKTREDLTLYNLNVGFQSAEYGLDVMLWCQNCSDERYYDQFFKAPLRGDSTKGYVGAPRMYGLTVSKQF